MSDSIFDHLQELLLKHNVAVRGVIHVGAHKGEEVPVYLKMAEGENILLIEPNPNFFQELDSLSLVYGVRVLDYAITNTDDDCVVLYVTPNSEQSSLLPPKDVPVTYSFGVTSVRLRCVAFLWANVLVIDVQGSELDVLKSADLDQFDAIVCELTDPPRYEGAATSKDIKDYLASHGFWQQARYPHADPQIEDGLFIKNQPWTQDHP